MEKSESNYSYHLQQDGIEIRNQAVIGRLNVYDCIKLKKLIDANIQKFIKDKLDVYEKTEKEIEQLRKELKQTLPEEKKNV